LIVTVIILVALSGCVQKDALPLGEKGETMALFADLGGKNIVIEQVNNTTQTMFKNNPPFNWRVSADLAGIKVNFFLPGNSTPAFKKALVETEMEGVKSSADNCTRLGYESIDIRMTPLGKPSNTAQPRTWSGTARMPIAGKYANVSLSDSGSRVVSQKTAYWDLGRYLTERPALAEKLDYPWAFIPEDHLIIGDYAEYNDDEGFKTTGSFSDVEYAWNCHGWFYDYFNFRCAETWLIGRSSSILTKEEIQGFENTSMQKGLVFTFLQG